jgi:hypothetical protein
LGLSYAPRETEGGGAPGGAPHPLVERGEREVDYIPNIVKSQQGRLSRTFGSFHKINREYMTLQVAELYFRYNTRDKSEHFGKAIEGC